MREEITIEWMNQRFSQKWPTPLNRIMDWPVWSIGAVNIICEGGSFYVSKTIPGDEINSEETIFPIVYTDQVTTLINLIAECNRE